MEIGRLGGHGRMGQWWMKAVLSYCSLITAPSYMLPVFDEPCVRYYHFFLKVLDGLTLCHLRLMMPRAL